MDQPFEVEIPDSGVVFTVAPGQSLVAASALHGVEILVGCSDGKCGTCVVKVLDGEVCHRDQVLSLEKRQQGWMCACVSRAKGDKLVLEIW